MSDSEPDYSLRMVPRLDIESVKVSEFDEFGFAQAIIERHEGYRQFPYKDSRGYLTVGYGRNLTSQGITELEGALLLARDVRDIEQAFTRFQWWGPLEPERKAVLLDMAYQLGFAGLLSFK